MLFADELILVLVAAGVLCLRVSVYGRVLEDVAMAVLLGVAAYAAVECSSPLRRCLEGLPSPAATMLCWVPVIWIALAAPLQLLLRWRQHARQASSRRSFSWARPLARCTLVVRAALYSTLAVVIFANICMVARQRLWRDGIEIDALAQRPWEPDATTTVRVLTAGLGGGTLPTELRWRTVGLDGSTMAAGTTECVGEARIQIANAKSVQAVELQALGPNAESSLRLPMQRPLALPWAHVALDRQYASVGDVVQARLVVLDLLTLQPRRPPAGLRVVARLHGMSSGPAFLVHGEDLANGVLSARATITAEWPSGSYAIELYADEERLPATGCTLHVGAPAATSTAIPNAASESPLLTPPVAPAVRLHCLDGVVPAAADLRCEVFTESSRTHLAVFRAGMRVAWVEVPGVGGRVDVPLPPMLVGVLHLVAYGDGVPLAWRRVLRLPTQRLVPELRGLLGANGEQCLLISTRDEHGMLMPCVAGVVAIATAADDRAEAPTSSLAAEVLGEQWNLAAAAMERSAKLASIDRHLAEVPWRDEELPSAVHARTDKSTTARQLQDLARQSFPWAVMVSCIGLVVIWLWIVGETAAWLVRLLGAACRRPVAVGWQLLAGTLAVAVLGTWAWQQAEPREGRRHPMGHTWQDVLIVARRGCERLSYDLLRDRDAFSKLPPAKPAREIGMPPLRDGTPSATKAPCVVLARCWMPDVAIDQTGEAIVTLPEAPPSSTWHVSVDLHAPGRIGSVAGTFPGK